MAKRLSGQDVDHRIGDRLVHFSEVTISIEDTSTASKTKGRPDGYVRGNVSANGEIKVDTANLSLILEMAKTAGSFEQLEPQDMVWNASSGDEQITIEAFECLLKLSEVLNAPSNGEEKLIHTIPYEVTGKDFVKINGVSYLNPEIAAGFN